MSRFLLPVLALTIALSVPGLVVSQAPTMKVDVNLASQADLQKLPGITQEIAQSILAKRPYDSPADLHRAGLSDPQIKKIEDLVIFTRIQVEKPGGKAGEIAGVNVMQFYRCEGTSTSDTATQIIASNSKRNEATVCIPPAWFVGDGYSLSATGQIKIPGLLDSLNKDATKHISIVVLGSANSTASRAWTLTPGVAMASKLRMLAYKNSLEVYSLPALEEASPEQVNFEREMPLNVQRMDLTTLADQSSYKNIDTWILVVPDKKNKEHP